MPIASNFEVKPAASADICIGFSHAHGHGGVRFGLTHLGLTTSLSFQALGQHTRFGIALLVIGVGLGLDHARFGHAGLFDRAGGSFLHFGIGQTRRRLFGARTFRQRLFRFGLFGGGHQFGLGPNGQLVGTMTRRLFGRFSRPDVHHQLLLGVRLGTKNGDLLGTVRFRNLTGLLDFLFGHGHGLFDLGTLADHVGDIHPALLNHLVALDTLQLHFFVGGDLLQLLGAGDTFNFNHYCATAVLLGHFDLAQLFLLANLDQLIGFKPRTLGDQPLFFLHLGGFGFFAGLHGSHFTLLLELCLGLLALHLQHVLARLGVFLGDREPLVLFQLVGLHVLHGREFGDLSNTFCVQNIVRIQIGFTRLF
ncbi:MAG: hypothetical protein ACTS5I_02045, partial [Rhodanobacter sp.]